MATDRTRIGELKGIVGGYLNLGTLAGTHLALPPAGIADDFEGFEDGMEHKPILEDILSLHNPENALRRCQFTIPGKPFGKQDSRHTKTGIQYVPTETKNYLSLVRLACANAWSGNPLDGPVSLEIVAIYPIPKGWSKKRRQEALNGLIEPTKKPDMSNVRKVVEDGIQGVVIEDDKQITQYRDLKKYGLKPEVRVLVEESPMRGL